LFLNPLPLLVSKDAIKQHRGRAIRYNSPLSKKTIGSKV
jgi:hypothetical protein